MADHTKVAEAICNAMEGINTADGYSPEAKLAMQNILFGIQTALGLGSIHFWAEYNKPHAGIEADYWVEAVDRLFGQLNIETADDLPPLIK